MRTVSENREDRYPKPVEQRELHIDKEEEHSDFIAELAAEFCGIYTKPVHPVHPLDKKDTLKHVFYDFGHPSGTRFVPIPDDEKSDWIEGLFKEFCGDE